jgi:hypothetical protein
LSSPTRNLRTLQGDWASSKNLQSHPYLFPIIRCIIWEARNASVKPVATARNQIGNRGPGGTVSKKFIVIMSANKVKGGTKNEGSCYRNWAMWL